MIKATTEDELIEKYCRRCNNTIQIDDKRKMCKYYVNINLIKCNDSFAKEYHCKYFIEKVGEVKYGFGT